jgi:hypothetical protein
MCTAGIMKRNPFASQALIDRIQGRVMVFTPFFDDELQTIAALELERLHQKMAHWEDTRIKSVCIFCFICCYLLLFVCCVLSFPSHGVW